MTIPAPRATLPRRKTPRRIDCKSASGIIAKGRLDRCQTRVSSQKDANEILPEIALGTEDEDFHGVTPAITFTKPCVLGWGFEILICTSQPNAFRNRKSRSLEKPSSLPRSRADTFG
jgi:hypothetical protein